MRISPTKRYKGSDDWVLLESSLTKDACNIHFQGFTWSSKVTNGGPGAKISKCNHEDGCGKLVRMRLTPGQSQFYEVHACGDHEHQYDISEPSSRGLHSLLLPYIDSLIHADQGAGVILTQLQKKFND